MKVLIFMYYACFFSRCNCRLKSAYLDGLHEFDWREGKCYFIKPVSKKFAKREIFRISFLAISSANFSSYFSLGYKKL